MKIIDKKKKLDYWMPCALELEMYYIDKDTLEIATAAAIQEYWKVFCFDMLDEMSKKSGMLYIENDSNKDLLPELKKNYLFWKKFYRLSIDIKDYPELICFQTLREWEQDENHHLIMDTDGEFYLVVTIEK